MRPSAAHCGLLALLALGCDARERTPGVSPATPLAELPSVGLEVVSSTGPAPLTGWVRSVNQYGASVGATAASVTVGGVASITSFDGVGYGGITIEVPGAVEVTAGSSAGTMHALPSDWAPPGVGPAAVAPTDSDRVATVTRGSLSIDGGEVWWVDAEGQRPHRVLSLQEPILGMRVGQIDVDGFDDAVVWTGSTVFLLRGRNGGGMSWGGGFAAPGYTVGGADVGDLSGDNLPDVAIAWVGGEEGGVFDVWMGDGLFGFTSAEPRLVDGIPTSLAVADNTGEGRPQATVLLSNGTWRRFIEGAPGRYLPIGPDTSANVFLPQGATLGERIDLDGDGAAEIPVIGPRVEGQVRQAYLFDIEQGMLVLPFVNEEAAWVAVGDGDGDLVDDIWFHQEQSRRLQVLTNEGRGATSSFPRYNILSDLVSHAPIAIDDIDGDGVNDIWLGDPLVHTWMLGRVFPGDPTRFWEYLEPDEVFLRESLVPPALDVVFDSDPATEEILAFHVEAGRLQLLMLEDRGTDRAERIGFAYLDDHGLPKKMAVCGRRAFVLLDSAVASVDLANRTLPVVTATLPLSAPRDVACGTGPSSATAVVLDGETVISLNNSLGELARSTLTGAQGLTFGDGGSGPEIKVCTQPGCQIVPWTLSDGSPVYVTADPTGVWLARADGSFTSLGGRADWLRVVDLDGDGVPELLGHDATARLVSVWYDLGGVVSPPRVWHQPIPWEGGIVVLDGDRDGVLDIAGVDTEDDALRFLGALPETTSGGTMSAPALDTGAPATGDTGLP